MTRYFVTLAYPIAILVFYLIFLFISHKGTNRWHLLLNYPGSLLANSGLCQGELTAGGAPISTIPVKGPKSQKEELGEMDEDGGHLYKRIKHLYKEGFEPGKLAIQGTTDSLAWYTSFHCGVELRPSLSHSLS